MLDVVLQICDNVLMRTTNRLPAAESPVDAAKRALRHRAYVLAGRKAAVERHRDISDDQQRFVDEAADALYAAARELVLAEQAAKADAASVIQ